MKKISHLDRAARSATWMLTFAILAAVCFDTGAWCLGATCAGIALLGLLGVGASVRAAVKAGELTESEPGGGR